MQSGKDELLAYRSLDSDGAPLFSEKVVARLTASLPDCCLESSDGTKYPVHQAKLQEQSTVLRDLLTHVATAAELPLHEDAATLRLLISGMYDAHCDVNWSNVKSLLELARKYDVQDIQQNCDGFLHREPLSTSNLPCYMDVACTFDMAFEVDRCQHYIATADNFKDLVRMHGEDWCKDLPGAVVMDIMNRRLKAVESSYASMVSTTQHEQQNLRRLVDKEDRYRQFMDYLRRLPLDKQERKDLNCKKYELRL